MKNNIIQFPINKVIKAKVLSQIQLDAEYSMRDFTDYKEEDREESIVDINCTLAELEVIKSLYLMEKTILQLPQNEHSENARQACLSLILFFYSI